MVIRPRHQKRTAALRMTCLLYLAVNVNKEGYNGEVELTNSNFTIESVNSDLANKISNSKVKINQLNTGATTKIELK